MLSRLGGRARTPKPFDERRTTGSDDDSVASLAASCPLGERPSYDRHATFVDEREAYHSRRVSLPVVQGEVADVDDFDTSDFDYSSGDDDDEFASPPLGRADGISGWSVGVRREEDDELRGEEEDGKREFKMDDATPRASAHVALVRGIESEPEVDVPELLTPSRKARDGSIRAGVEGGKRWACAPEEEDEEDGTEIFLAVRRRRATTGA